jgi:hypothetical protein
VITNYGTLKTELAATSHRGDMTARIPFFVQRAEGMIAARVRSTLNYANGTLLEVHRQSPGSGLYDLPSDCLDPVGMFVGVEPLTRRTIAELLAFESGSGVHSYSVRSSATGALVADFRGVPATDATMTFLYYARLAAFSADADTNPLLVAHSELYFHAALFWLYLDTHDLEMSQAHKELFEAECERVNLEARRALRSGAIQSLDRIRHGSVM